MAPVPYSLDFIGAWNFYGGRLATLVQNYKGIASSVIIYNEYSRLTAPFYPY